MEQLNIPPKLYGRERDLEKILNSFERISRGHGEILLIPGYSGVGKTSLVNELKKPVRAKNGFFISGKFDQYKQNIPFYAFRQALTELCQELEAEDALSRDRYKAEILEAIGNLGQLLIDLVPEFESFLGVQPPLGEISPQEARYRFAGVFQNFLKVICVPEHPLVLFIDDWQWADAASFELLKLIQVGVNLRYLAVIVSYRNNEVNQAHPLTTTLDELRRQDVPVETLEINNINEEDIQKLVGDSLDQAFKNTSELGTIIFNKTQGNPFFAKSFLIFLYELQLINFDKNQQCWYWDIDKIRKAELPNSVLDLFILKLHRLDVKSRKLFSLAACLGNRFDLENLSNISGQTLDECIMQFSSSEAKSMFLLINADEYGQKNEINGQSQYIFLHDQVQQAAFSLIDKVDLPEILLKIGRILLGSLSPEQLNDRLFEVVSDLNAGFTLVQDNLQRIQLIELNLKAAQKAFSATAYRSALQFCRAANQFMNINEFAEYLWNQHHDLSISLFRELAEIEFIEGERDLAENYIQQAVALSKTPIEKADLLNILIVQYTLTARYEEAIFWGRQALSELGISLPKTGFEEARNQEIQLVREELGTRLVSSLFELPVMSNPAMLMATKILITIGPPCYRSHQRLWGVIVPKVVNLTLRFGNIPQVGYSHTAFGGLLGWVDNDYVAAKEFGELATRLMHQKFHSPSHQSVFYLMIGSSIRHWFRHLRYGTQDYTDAYEIGLQSGNLQYAAYAFGHNMYCRFYQGVPITALISETEKSLEFSRTRLNRWAIDLLEGGLSIFASLSIANPAINPEQEWLEELYLQQLKNHNNIQVECIYKVLRTFSLLLQGQYESALNSSDETEPLIYTVGTQGLLPWPEHVFARFLILSELYSKEEKKVQNKWHAELDQILNKLRIWSDNCPENFKHKYLLASAEMARIDFKDLEAMKLYDQALEEARSGNFVQWEGMVNERAYRFWKENGNECLADVYWRQAYICYNRWGAEAKIKLMENEYRIHIAKNLSEIKGSGVTPNQEQEIKNDLLDKQIELLRNYALQNKQTKLLQEAETHASELANATQRLRIEIAGRKRTEQALRESEERFKKLFLEAPLGIALIDSLTGQVYDFNPMFAKIAGRTMEEMAHIDWMSLTHPDDVQDDLDHMALMNAGKIPGFQMEKRYIHHDGSSVWINMTIAPIYIEDRTQPRHLCMIEDISERKQAQEQIKFQNEQLQKINAEKDKFFSIIAHDLRSPFNGFLGLTHIMAEELPRLTMAQVQELAVSMQNSATNLHSLLENLLQWSQKQQGLIPFHPEIIHLHLVVEETIAVLLESAKEKQIEILNTISIGFTVFADLNMFQTIIRNLVSNAVKFTPNGGRITIDASIHNETMLKISVSDTGIGMSPNLLNRLFRLDESANRKGTNNEPSTGLGLLLCKEFVEKNNGKIWVESQEGKGSTFYFTIPLKTVGESEIFSNPVATTSKKTEPNKKLKVLLVEDDKTSEMLLQIAISRFSSGVLHVDTGVDAIEACRNNPDIDLILIDIKMPVMDGLEATRRIREFNKDVVIIAQTAYSMTGEKEKALQAGCNDFISKPIVIPDLLAIINRRCKT